MWVAKFKYKHDCILGNRCKSFKITLQSVAFPVFVQNGERVVSSMHYMSGNQKNLDQFIQDLKSDEKVIKLEQNGNLFFLLEKAKRKAVQFYSPKLIFIKPVLMDQLGYELWEIGSWEKEQVSHFITSIKGQVQDFRLLKFNKVKLDEVFFPRLMPNLTGKQKRAIELAIAEGYYKRPKKTSLRKLAQSMGVSLATYQQHLQTAEEKLIPNLFAYSN